MGFSFFGLRFRVQGSRCRVQGLSTASLPGARPQLASRGVRWRRLVKGLGLRLQYFFLRQHSKKKEFNNGWIGTPKYAKKKASRIAALSHLPSISCFRLTKHSQSDMLALQYTCAFFGAGKRPSRHRQSGLSSGRVFLGDTRGN